MRATCLIALAGACATLALDSPALGAIPAVTSQDQAANAAFLGYAPAPTDGAGALCLVDTGVHANPDTSPGLISATALDGGSGEDVDPQGHGTTMAAIAGAAGVGMVGAWPQLKIVSVRATEEPSPGQEPAFEFDDYAEGIEHCLQEQGGSHIDAVDLAMSSTIPPSPDQAATLQSAIAQAAAKNVAIIAAAGNNPGPVQEPGAEPGIFAVGAFTAQPDQTSSGPPGSVCSFSADQGLTFYAPGCGLDQLEPFTDRPVCCGNGTSQASAFAAAVVVALMSYDPGLSYTHAEQMLISTATDGDLNVAEAFQAAGLGSVVAAGNLNVPKPPPQPPSDTQSGPSPTTVPGPVQVRVLRWRRGVLTIKVAALPAGARLEIQLDFHHATRELVATHAVIKVHTRWPRVIDLRLAVGQVDGPVVRETLRK